MTEMPIDHLETATLDTKERLIEAGMAVFAEHGFADAGVRAICAQAGANPAAVNYHFGDKQRFYAEVLATCHLRAAAQNPLPTLADDPDRPQEVLRLWVRWFLELLLVTSRNGHMGRLMAQEMVSPSPALDEMVRRSFLPMKGVLEEILRALLPPGADDATLGLCFASTLSQCLFYKHSQPIYAAMERIRANGNEDERLLAQLPDPDDLDLLADHITCFSVAGIQAAGLGEAGPDAKETS